MVVDEAKVVVKEAMAEDEEVEKLRVTITRVMTTTKEDAKKEATDVKRVDMEVAVKMTMALVASREDMEEEVTCLRAESKFLYAMVFS